MNFLQPTKIHFLKLKPIKLKFNSNLRMPKGNLKSVLYGKHFSEKGKYFEARVRKHLRDKGYTISKSHNRHYDIHATKNGKTYYVECKCLTARLSPDQNDFMHKTPKKGGIYVIARKDKNRRVKLKFYR